jgi:hypothetical protein
MKGLDLFYETAKKRNYTLGATDTSSGDSNGNFKITNSEGKHTMQNFKRIAEVYGTFTFFHFSQEEAIEQIFELIDTQINLGQ